MATRHVCFTINNWTEKVYEQVTGFDWQYIVVGKEIGTKNGVPHLQCYGCFHKKRNYKKLAKAWGAHFEVMRGTPKQASDYCKKDKEYFEKGDVPESKDHAGGQATKEKYATIIRQAEEGRLEEIKEENPEIYLRCYTTLNKIKQANMKAVPELEQLDNAWLWGPPGIGKSSAARETAKGAFYPKALNKWWDGYRGEDFVIIDDWEKNCHLGHHLKIWADHYDFIGETKGGSIRIRPKHIIVTSNYSIDECFEGEEKEAIKRRFTIHHFDRLNKNS